MRAHGSLNALILKWLATTRRHSNRKAYPTGPKGMGVMADKPILRIRRTVRATAAEPLHGSLTTMDKIKNLYTDSHTRALESRVFDVNTFKEYDPSSELPRKG